MRKIALVVLIFNLISNITLAQEEDFIVKYSNDTIHCKITKVKTKYISFFIMNQGVKIDSKIPTTEVKDYAWNSMPENQNYDEICVSFNTGPAYRNGNAYGRLSKSYVNQVRQGFNFGMDVNYFNSDDFGFGVKYNRFSSRASVDSGLINFVDSVSGVGNFKDGVSISFFGPAYYQRFAFDNKKGFTTVSVSVGYVTYKNEATYIDSTYTLNNQGFGLCGTLGYDFKIYKNLLVGTKANLMWSWVDNKQIMIDEYIYDIDGLGQVAYMNLSVGIRYIFKSAKL